MNDEIERSSLQQVSGGWDWGRTGRAAGDGAAAPFRSPFRVWKNVGERVLGKTVGPYVGGALGVVSTVSGAPLLTTPLNMAGDAIFQAQGLSEHRYDNAAIRNQLWLD